jgi:hypothetical protein
MLRVPVALLILAVLVVRCQRMVPIRWHRTTNLLIW